MERSAARDAVVGDGQVRPPAQRERRDPGGARGKGGGQVPRRVAAVRCRRRGQRRVVDEARRRRRRERVSKRTRRVSSDAPGQRDAKTNRVVAILRRRDAVLLVAAHARHADRRAVSLRQRRAGEDDGSGSAKRNSAVSRRATRS